MHLICHIHISKPNDDDATHSICCCCATDRDRAENGMCGCIATDRRKRSVGRCVGGGGVEIPPSLSSLSLSPHVSESKKKPSMCPGSSPPPLTASPSLVVFWWRVTVEVNILVRVKAGGQDLIMP